MHAVCSDFCVSHMCLQLNRAPESGGDGGAGAAPGHRDDAEVGATPPDSPPLFGVKERGTCKRAGARMGRVLEGPGSGHPAQGQGPGQGEEGTIHRQGRRRILISGQPLIDRPRGFCFFHLAGTLLPSSVQESRAAAGLQGAPLSMPWPARKKSLGPPSFVS